MSRFARSPLAAVLGPTNTGKTHLAVERMLGHSSGMMGFPLRLLAREVYDRVVALKGEGAAALVTGEERIWPDSARYILSTVEAMPLPGEGVDPPAFVAVDEAQLGQDRERGHVFTARLLHARGREETMILGADTLTPVVRALLPDAEIVSRPRFSTLSYAGPKKLSRLPPRSVIVAFSAEEVYGIAEALRRFSGGAAVVMGALSPATRNAQVAMFQAGEVDYLVATDAIGMGLNLDVGHVAFASLNKFDGQRQRRLTVAEMAQIAGRAGRHQRDGSFGSVGAEAAFTPEEIDAIEQHRFVPLDWLHWRNPAPAMDSVAGLIADLETPPSDPMLRPAPEATDLAVLRRMQGDADAMALVDGPDAVRRLWAACSLPDFTRAGPENHARLVARLWRDLGGGAGHINAGWVETQLAALDRADGSVEALGDRIARVRTFCYIAQRGDWLADAPAVAERARQVEGNLSDALHNALTARFVDRRTTVLLRALGQEAGNLPVTVTPEGAVLVDGEGIGHLDGFAFRVDPATRAADQRMLLAAAERHLAVELAARATALASAPEDALALVLSGDGPPEIHWHGLAVATLERGRNSLAPRVAPVRAVAALDEHIVAAVIARLDEFVDSRVSRHLRPLVAMAGRARDPQAGACLRAVLAGLVDGGGIVERAEVDSSLAGMSPEERAELRRLGVRVGTLDLFHPQMLKPGALEWLAALDGARRGAAAVSPPRPGIALTPAQAEMRAPVGFRRIGDWWLRVDMIERVALHAHNARRAALEAAKTPAVENDENPAETPAETPAENPTGGEAAVDSPRAVEAPAAPSPAPVPASERGFRIDPELARSIGLPLADRLALYAALGFRTAVAASGITAEDEAELVWSWRGRRKPRPRYERTPRKESQPRGERGGQRGGQRAGQRPDQERGRKPKHPREARSPREREQGRTRAPAQPINNPFGALAGLFDSKSDT